jgi:hypothetical protein
MASRTMKDRLAEADGRAEAALQARNGTPEAAPSTDGDGDLSDPARQNPVDWKHKYEVLEGKYRAEVPKLHAAVQEQASKITELTVAVSKRATLEDEGAVAVDLMDFEKNPKLKEFKEEYPDVFEGVVEIVKAAKTPANKKDTTQTPATPQTQQPAQSPAWTSAMYQLLDAKIPDWRTINQDQGFVQWLSEKDVYSRKTKNDLLLDAYAAGDVETVANMFGGFKAIAQEDNQDQDDLAPSSTTSGSVDNTQSAQTTITRAYISKFYQDVALGRYKGKEKLMNEIHAKIDSALVSRAVQ